MPYRSWLYAIFSLTLVALPVYGVGPLPAEAADDCTTLHSQIFGSGPNDMQSAAFRYKNYKSALAKEQKALAYSEQVLEEVRKQSAAYFLAHGNTDATLELKLRTMTERVREHRANVKYFSPKLSAAAATLRRLSTEYKRLGCSAGGATTTEDWGGTYVDNAGHKLEISGSGATFTAEATWTASATQGGSSTFHCTAHGSTATCTGSGKYFDPDKTITTTLETTLSKSGSTIRETDKVLTASCKPEKEGVSDCKALGYEPAVHAGAEFTEIMQKQ